MRIVQRGVGQFWTRGYELCFCTDYRGMLRMQSLRWCGEYPDRSFENRMADDYNFDEMVKRSYFSWSEV